MKAVVLCAGRGERLGALTETMAKPALPVGGEPILCRILKWLREQGITQVCINMHYRGETLLEAVKPLQSEFDLIWGFELQPKGTAGALANFERHLDETFVVVNGDMLITGDLAPLVRFHREKRSHLTLGTMPVEDPTRVGVAMVTRTGRVHDFHEKPTRELIETYTLVNENGAGRNRITNQANAGILVMEPRVLGLIPRSIPTHLGEYLVPELLYRGRRVYAQPFAGTVQDLGTPEAFRQADMTLKYLQQGADTYTGLTDERVPDVFAAALNDGHLKPVSSRFEVHFPKPLQPPNFSPRSP